MRLFISYAKRRSHDPPCQHALDAVEVARGLAIAAQEDKLLRRIQRIEVVG